MSPNKQNSERGIETAAQHKPQECATVVRTNRIPSGELKLASVQDEADSDFCPNKQNSERGIETS